LKPLAEKNRWGVYSPSYQKGCLSVSYHAGKERTTPEAVSRSRKKRGETQKAQQKSLSGMYTPESGKHFLTLLSKKVGGKMQTLEKCPNLRKGKKRT